LAARAFDGRPEIGEFVGYDLEFFMTTVIHDYNKA